jgi:hypothetical protein
VYYIWDSKKVGSTQTGAYQTFSFLNNYQPIPGGGSYPIGQSNTKIECGQGFFVTGSGLLTFNEEAKVASTSNQAFRPVRSSADLVKIDTRLYDAASGTILDGNAVVFDAAYSNAVDQNDVPKMTNTTENFGLTKSGKVLSIEGRHPLNAQDEVAFKMTNMQAKEYKLEIAAMNIPEGLSAMLEDRYVGSSSPIDLTGTTIYSFQVENNAAAKDPARFRILFGSKGSVIAQAHPAISVSPNPVKGKMINLQMTDLPKGNYQVSLIGTDGRVIMNRRVAHPGNTALQIINVSSEVLAGVYQLQVTGTGKEKFVQSILIE